MKTPLYSFTSLRNKTLFYYSCREVSHITQINFNDTTIPLQPVFSLIKKKLSGSLHVLLTDVFIF